MDRNLAHGEQSSIEFLTFNSLIDKNRNGWQLCGASSHWSTLLQSVFSVFATFPPICFSISATISLLYLLFLRLAKDFHNTTQSFLWHSIRFLHLRHVAHLSRSCHQNDHSTCHPTKTLKSKPKFNTMSLTWTLQ
jgi:hypothetical protein